jgi:hypothetical protein
MPDGSGAVMLLSKTDGKLRSVAVIPLKAVSTEPGGTPIWTTIANVVMPHQLALGYEQPAWKDLLKYQAYRKAVRIADRPANKKRKPTR